MSNCATCLRGRLSTEPRKKPADNAKQLKETFKGKDSKIILSFRYSTAGGFLGCLVE
jgi:hypothetical protein